MNTSKTRKATSTRNNTPAIIPAPVQAKPAPALSLAAMQSQIDRIEAVIAALASHVLPAQDSEAVPTPAEVVMPETARAKSRTRKGTKRTPDADPAKQAKKQAHIARKQALANAATVGEATPWAKAITLAAKQARVNRAAGLVNASIQACSPDSPRVWLTSVEHRAFKSSRNAHEISPQDADAALAKALGK